MCKKYLCANHSQQMRNYPRQAVRAWSKSYENGQSLISMGFKYDALAHIGCAYEAAEIALSANIIDTFDAVTMLTSSAATLAKLLNELGQYSESQEVIELTTYRIEKEYDAVPEQRALLQNQVNALHYFVSAPEQTEYPLDEKQLTMLNVSVSSRSSALH